MKAQIHRSTQYRRNRLRNQVAMKIDNIASLLSEDSMFGDEVSDLRRIGYRVIDRLTKTSSHTGTKLTGVAV